MAKTQKQIDSLIKVYEKLKAGPDKQIEKYKGMIEGLGTGEDLEGIKKKLFDSKLKNYQKMLSTFQARSQSYADKIAALTGGGAEPPPEPEPEPEPPPLDPIVIPGGGGAEEPEYPDEAEEEGNAQISQEIEAARGSKGKQKTILTSPEGVTSTAKKIIKKLNKVA